MILSVVGQNERWAQQAALQPLPAAQSNKTGGPVCSNVGTTAGDAATINPIAGNAPSPLSSNMSFMLTMLGGELDSPAAGGTGGNGGSGLTSASPTEGSNTQGGSASTLADLQSLVKRFTGGSSRTSDTASISSGAVSAGDPILQNLDGVVSKTSTKGEQPPGPPYSAAAAGQASYQDDIMNSGAAAVATWGDGPSGPGGGWQEMFARAAYQSGSALGPNSQSLWQNVSV